MTCKYCSSDQTIKKGKRNNIQRFRCKSCHKTFQSTYKNNACLEDTDDKITVLLKEGCGIRSIARILKISKQTVLSRMLKIAGRIKNSHRFSAGKRYEVDEMWTYVGNKKEVSWVTYGIERKSRRVVDFIVGRKTSENIKPLIDRILSFSPKRIYTDGLNIYPCLIPKDVHVAGRFHTTKIERKNLSLRTHIKRLSRKTICFSKSQKYLTAHLAIYFWST